MATIHLLKPTWRAKKDHIVTIDIVDGEVNTVLFEPDSAAYRTISQTLGAVSIGKVL